MSSLDGLPRVGGSIGMQGWVGVLLRLAAYTWHSNAGQVPVSFKLPFSHGQYGGWGALGAGGGCSGQVLASELICSTVQTRDHSLSD